MRTSLLVYWRNSNESMPGLSCMAKDFLAPGVSSASVERRFSKAGHILSKRRNRLGTSATSSFSDMDPSSTEILPNPPRRARLNPFF